MQDCINSSVSATFYAETYSSLLELQPCKGLVFILLLHKFLSSAFCLVLWLFLWGTVVSPTSTPSKKLKDERSHFLGPHPLTCLVRVSLSRAYALASTALLIIEVRIPPRHYKNEALEEVYWNYNSDNNREFRLEFIKPTFLTNLMLLVSYTNNVISQFNKKLSFICELERW
jgi:hypothetical protein